MKYGVIERSWEGDTVACIASGPSLTQADVDYVRGKARVIVINASYVLAPWADVLYCADAKPFRWYWKKGPQGFADMPMRDFKGQIYCLTPGTELDKRVVLLRRGVQTGLSANPSVLNTGNNSGFQSINLAVLKGAKRIVLLGFDMQQGLKKEEHWHPDHPNKSRSNYPALRGHFQSLVDPLKALGVQVVNCTRRSALKTFQQMPLDQFLPQQMEQVA